MIDYPVFRGAQCPLPTQLRTLRDWSVFGLINCSLYLPIVSFFAEVFHDARNDFASPSNTKTINLRRRTIFLQRCKSLDRNALFEIVGFKTRLLFPVRPLAGMRRKLMIHL